MSFRVIKTSSIAGELSPSIYGRTDLAKFGLGGATYRNFFAGYRGGAYSRPGLAYCGMCKQLGTSLPPRDIQFQFNNQQGFALEFGDNYMRVKSNGAYVTETPKNLSAATTANPGVFTVTAHGFSNDDWVFGSGIGGMVGLNGLTWIVKNVTTNTFTLTDLFGNVVNTFIFPAYTSGGTFSRIYTLATPYAAVDLPYLKFTQSADTMTLDCVNPNTLTGLPAVEYPSYSLVRTGAASYTLTAITYTSPIAAPTGCTGSVTSSTTLSTFYSYVVTAVDGNGNESVASNANSLKNNDISINAGSNTTTWNAVTGAIYYNIYRATPLYGSSPVPVGVNYGYLGESFGTSFVDTNITADFTRVPPKHQDPFARGQITGVVRTAGGSGYTQAGITYSITTSTGSGFAGTPIVLAGVFVGFLIDNNGKNYAPSDTITFTADGSGATATLTIGAQTGTYPAVPAYLFQRAVQANTLNAPDNYFMSQPGKYFNMDSSIPITDGDAIIGNPWAQQVNGIQFIQPMLSAAVMFTGAGTWLLSGGGGVGTPFTPTSQQATPQEYNGISSTVPPIALNSEILYVQSLGNTVRDLTYNFFTQRCTSTDITVLSSHLFENHQLLQWAYAQEPFKLIWGVRNDGMALSLTFIKEQEVQAWTRHDTNGLFFGVCSVTEPPVNAVYWIVKRYINGGWHYYSERFNNRLWQTIEDSFCVDAGLSYPQNTPNATLTPSGIDGTITLTASSAVFTAANVGDVVRVGGGICDVVAPFISTTVLTAVVRDGQTITAIVPDDPNNIPVPVPATAGSWTITTPTMIVTGLNHLIGKTVTGLADGSVIDNQTVVDFGNGTVGITLQQPASAINVGLSFLPQFQSMYLDPPSQETPQTTRKSINQVAVRVERTRGISVGTNQKDAATQPNGGNPIWSNMTEIKMRTRGIPAGQPIPLQTNDFILPVQGGWNEKAQVAIQQSYPLPASLSAFIIYYSQGDSSG